MKNKHQVNLDSIWLMRNKYYQETGSYPKWISIHPIHKENLINQVVHRSEGTMDSEGNHWCFGMKIDWNERVFKSELICRSNLNQEKVLPIKLHTYLDKMEDLLTDIKIQMNEEIVDMKKKKETSRRLLKFKLFGLALLLSLILSFFPCAFLLKSTNIFEWSGNQIVIYVWICLIHLIVIYGSQRN